MNILLVNDDGIDSALLDFAAKVLNDIGDVTVVAPRNQQSGKSMSISMGDMSFEQRELDKYAIDGTPADCVSFALFGLGLEPDVVVSGINKGYNLGIDTRYSGTVGAALQAHFNKLKSIAFSTHPRGINTVKAHFYNVFNFILKNNVLSPEHVINVNFPKDSFVETTEMRFTKLYYLRHSYKVTMKNDVFSKKRAGYLDPLPEDSDIHAVNNGYISISKINLD